MSPKEEKKTAIRKSNCHSEKKTNLLIARLSKITVPKG